MTAAVAFVSYVRFDDKHESGRLTEFCNLLSAEVRVQTGERFQIFQDRNDIQWGQNWTERIEKAIDAITFLIPIVTPSFFKSSACRNELERFLKREQHLERNDLVLPVYYVGCSVLDDEEKRATDRLVQAIAAHQVADWRDLRFEPFTSPEVRRTLARMAVDVRDALDRNTAGARTSGRAVAAGTPTVGDAAPADESPRKGLGPSGGPAGKTAPPTRVVDPLHRGDHATI